MIRSQMKGRPSRTDAWVRATAVATLALALALLPASPAAAADLLPDLVPDPPTNPRLSAESLGDGQIHLLLRFDGFIHNVGDGALEIRGSNPSAGRMTTSFQRIYTDGGSRDDYSRHPDIYFENSDGHMHWHVRSAARFSIWSEDGTAEVARSAKVGFCLQDVTAIDSFAPPRVYSSDATQYCRQGQPDAPTIFEGISRGWRDVYAAKLPFQWVDVSDVAPGRYLPAAQVDPDDFVIEGNEADNGPALAATTAIVPGYVALPGAVVVSKAQPIALSAAQYGSPGPRTFAIESAPRHGTLSAPAGVPFAGPQVTYTPASGFAGTDTFAYSARDTASPFPLHSPAATVTVTVPAKVRQKLLSGLRFTRRGRLLVARARARRSGVLKISIVRGKRQLGSCRKRIRAGHRFRCRSKLRRHAKPAGAKAVVKLVRGGKTIARETHRVPRHIRSAR
jgi:hypothetical protein